MRALFDVNALIALFDRDHVGHRRVRSWLSEHIEAGWASCAVTQNGFVRVVSQPAYPNPVTPAEAVARLSRATGTAHHEYWTRGVSLVDERVVSRDHVLGHRQITDVYLLALAVASGGRLVTLDRSIPLAAVIDAAADHVVVL